MQVTDELVRNVVSQVLTQMRNGKAPSNGKAGPASGAGVFSDVNDAVSAALAAQRTFEARGLEDRRKAVACVRKICTEQAAQLGRADREETNTGRRAPTITKLQVIPHRTPRA